MDYHQMISHSLAFFAGVVLTGYGTQAYYDGVTQVAQEPVIAAAKEAAKEAVEAVATANAETSKDVTEIATKAVESALTPDSPAVKAIINAAREGQK